MASLLGLQLQAIQPYAQADLQSSKRPLTRPSILFDPKEAADIGIETIFSNALSGLDVLVDMDERFRSYKNDLFSQKSSELDRELLTVEENDRINTSITSYLRLLSGHLQLQSALRTLEYLIRRYKVHVYNAEELILCALPYHDTHVFVRIVHLFDTGNSRWKFLHGVKVSGAPPPRMLIVQQCLRDIGVLEAICNYSLPLKKRQASRPVISFCTALVIETLGSMTSVDSEVAGRVLPFVSAGLKPGPKGDIEHKAGALMIIALLSNKVALSPKLVKPLIVSITEVAREDAKDSNDLKCLHISFMALINLIQLQCVEVLPNKAMQMLVEIRDLAGILKGLNEKFIIEKFLRVFLGSLVEYRFSNDSCHPVLISLLEIVPIKGFIDRIVFKLLSMCLKSSQKGGGSSSFQSASWAKQILVLVNNNYQSELRAAVHQFMKDAKVQSKDATTFQIMCRTLDGNFNETDGPSDVEMWLSLEHPKAEVRRAILLNLDRYGIGEDNLTASQRLVSIQDAILRRLHDEDLAVVQAALSLKCLTKSVNCQPLFEALRNVLKRCVHVLFSDPSHKNSLASAVGRSCLKLAVSSFRERSDCRKELIIMVFPLLLILPKTQKLNLTALESSKEISCPLFSNLSSASRQDKMDFGSISTVNAETVCALASSASTYLKEYLSLIIECCSDFEISKTLFFLVLMQSFINQNSDTFTLVEASFPVLKSFWRVTEAAGDSVPADEYDPQMLESDCKLHLNRLLDTNPTELNADLLVCVFWKLLVALVSTEPADISSDHGRNWLSILENLFEFFAESQPNHIFEKHRHYLLTSCRVSPLMILSKFFTREDVPVALQAESLSCFAYLCSQTGETLPLQLLAEFPSVLVPLCSDNQDTRIVSMKCIEGLLTLWPSVNALIGKAAGRGAIWNRFLGELLRLFVEQKELIISDKNFLPSFLTSLLSSSCHSLLVPDNNQQRFDQSIKGDILHFILESALKVSTYAKLKILSLLKGIGNSILHVKGVESLLSELLKRRRQCHIEPRKSVQQLSALEVEITCILLEICMTPSSERFSFEDYIVETLQVDGISSVNTVIRKPCLTVLQSLSRPFYSGLQTSVQEKVLCQLVHLFRSHDANIQNEAKQALLRIEIASSTLCQILDSVVEDGTYSNDERYRKKKKHQRKNELGSHLVFKGSNALSFLSSFLDVLLLKRNMHNRDSLVKPLFKLLARLFDKEFVVRATDQDQGQGQDQEGQLHGLSEIRQSVSSTICYIQQTLLLVLQEIVASVTADCPPKGDVVNSSHVKLLVSCANSSKDSATRNHVFSLLSTIARADPATILDHLVNILAVVGDSATTQFDRHSQNVFENLISALVPCWISQTNSTDDLLQIFISVLPDLPGHRRLSIVLYLIRTLEAHDSLGSLLFLLFRSLVSRKTSSPSEDNMCYWDLTSGAYKEWEYLFATEVCAQFSCVIWLPSLVNLFQKIKKIEDHHTEYLELILVMQFVLKKLQDPEFTFKLQSGEDSDAVQSLLGVLMEQVISCFQVLGSKTKSICVSSIGRGQWNECLHTILRTITKAMRPLVYFNCIVELLAREDANIKIKSLELLCETVKDAGKLSKKHEKKESDVNSLHLGEDRQKALKSVCREIVRLLDEDVDVSDVPLKLAASSALEVLTNQFPNDTSVFGSCLAVVSRNIDSDNLIVSSSCLKTSASLINVLGLVALPELPHIMNNVLQRSRVEFFKHLPRLATKSRRRYGKLLLVSKESYMLSLLSTLEAIIDKLGGFLNPYLKDVIELLVLHPDYLSSLDPKLKSKVDTVRCLVTERIPVRLALPPLTSLYTDAVNYGESSLLAAFEMLTNLIKTMDKSSIGSYHSKIFELCLQGLDLRRQHPLSIKNIDVVESTVVNAMIGLTMKLTEGLFRPLFINCIEWAEQNSGEEHTGNADVERAISFYVFVNKLAESHRSLFVPYFKYLRDDCIKHLTAENAEAVNISRKKKKAKHSEARDSRNDGAFTLSVENWHLRALVISSLHKCFLFDTGSQKFLDSNNFQVLLKPIVTQLAAEPPVSLEDHLNVSSLREVDDSLVACIGQMAIAAGNDLLWKSLNHEVLMHTRSESVRSQILSLRIVKYLVESLKEEYVVFVAETIPFLAELIESADLQVKSLTQEVIRDMESVSGENLRDFL